LSIAGKLETDCLNTGPNMVPKVGLEPTRLTPLPPQDSVSTNFTTSAKKPGIQSVPLGAPWPNHGTREAEDYFGIPGAFGASGAMGAVGGAGTAGADSGAWLVTLLDGGGVWFVR
jgi:hypothetical protein